MNAIFKDSEYQQISKLLFDIVQSVKGQKVSNYDMGLLNSTRVLWAHTITAYHIKHGSKLYEPYEVELAPYLHNFLSLGSIARSIIDTYLNIFETFIEPQTDDEKEYAHCIFELRGFRIRETNIIHIKPNLSRLPIWKEKLDSIEEIKNRILNTDFFKNLTPKQQNSTFKKGDRFYREGERSQIQRFIKAGLSVKLMSPLYALYSDYTHGGAVGSAQLGQSDDEAIEINMATSMALIMIVMARLILDLVNKFPSAKSTYDKSSLDIIGLMLNLINLGSVK